MERIGGHKMNKKLFLILFITVLLAAAGGALYACETNLIAGSMDWRPQDYAGNRGITAVQYNEVKNRLVLTCEFKGGDTQMSSGEILLDLKYVPCLEPNVPVDMRNRVIKVEIEIPTGLVGDPHAPNGCQVFVKDTGYKTQYGTWINLTSGGTITLQLQPSTETPTWGSTDPDFNPAEIRIIGIKIAINSSSTHSYTGPVNIRKIEVTPALPFGSPPEIPAGNPMPFVTADSTVTMEEDGFYIGNKKWFIVGGNWRLIEYRQNFGSTPWFPFGSGVSLHTGYLAARLGWYRQAGITLLRVGLLDDGTTMMDINGSVTGYNQVFRNDVSSLLDLAEQYDMKVEFVLADFLIAGKAEDIDGVWIRGRREIIEDSPVRANFIKNFLDPFLDEFGNEPAVFGFDIINEPEWIISKTDGGGWEDVTDKNKAETPVSLNQFKTFVTLCTQKIRELAPGKFVTVGVSCGNTILTDNLDLDYTAVHYYPNMGILKTNLVKAFGDKPWSLEEYEGKGDIYTYLETVEENGGAGALLWNLTPESDAHCYSFEDEEEKLNEVRRFVDYLASLEPAIALNRDQLFFAANTSGSVTGPQVFSISNSGTGTLNWDIEDDAAWLTCSPDSGKGSGTVTVSANPTGLAAGTYTGTVTVSDPGAPNSPQTVNVVLTVSDTGSTGLPFGEFSTPIAGSTVSSSIAVTGWVLDDIGVNSVKIYSGQTYIGDALFVEGARADIETAFPGYPQNYRAGWGYMLLTNFLPGGGNGVYTLYAFAEDMEGHRVTLGSKTITVDNLNAVKPFGAIDTPTQGGAASGSAFANQGWALTPMPNQIPVNGSTIKLYIDSVLISSTAIYNLYRPDIAGYFPGYANSEGAGVKFTIDTSAYGNGVHTIFWIAADDAGNTDGIGSRFFTIQGTSSSRRQETINTSSFSEIPADISQPIGVIRGFRSSATPQLVYPGSDGKISIEMEELERIELRLGPGESKWSGFRITAGKPGALPAGSTLDTKKGIFYWQPAAGFLGQFDLIFIRTGPNPTGKKEKKHVTINLFKDSKMGS